MNALISIIVPVFNRQNVIEECLRSAFVQTYRNFELLVIDDGSTDDTLAICRRLAEEEPRIKLLSGDHAGVSAARNKGLDAAAGEYIFFLDSDDVLHPRLLETLVTGMEGTDAKIGASQGAIVSQANWHRVKAYIEAHPDAGETIYYSPEETLQVLLTPGHSPFNFMGGTMIHRDLMGQTRFRTNLFIGEDFQFVYDNIAKGASSVVLRQKLYFTGFTTQTPPTILAMTHL